MLFVCWLPLFAKSNKFLKKLGTDFSLAWHLLFMKQMLQSHGSNVHNRSVSTIIQPSNILLVTVFPAASLQGPLFYWSLSKTQQDLKCSFKTHPDCAFNTIVPLFGKRGSVGELKP